MNWLGIVAFILVIVFGGIGYCRGFLRTVFSLVAAIVSIVITAIATPVIGDVVAKNDTIYSGIYNVVEEKIVESSEYEEIVKSIEDVTTSETLENGKVNAEEFVKDINIPDEYEDDIIEGIEKNLGKTVSVDDATEYVCDYITRVILNAIVYVVTLIAVSALVFVLVRVLIKMGELPVIREFDKLAGMAAGIALGVLVVMIFMVIVTMCSNSSFGESALECISENEILSWVYDNNPILNWISKQI